MRFFLPYIFLFCLLILINKCKSEDSYVKPIKFRQRILEQSTYYENDTINFTRCFLDFHELKYYYIDTKNIHSINTDNPLFRFFIDKTDKENAKISIKCQEDGKIKCNSIDLDEHTSIQFFYDYRLASTGCILTFLLVLVGLFCLRNGYIYYNLTIAFYSAFSFILFWREFCEFLELLDQLNTKDATSQRVAYCVYLFSILTSVVFGYISMKIKYIRYFTFGYIDGLVISKFLYFLILDGIDSSIILKYFITELVFCLAFIIFWVIFKEKYPNITMVNICVISTYGIIFGTNLIVGGLPFIPFYILAKAAKVEKDIPAKMDTDIYDLMKGKSHLDIYTGIFIFFVLIGSYFNISNYKAFMEKKKKNISTY